MTFNYYFEKKNTASFVIICWPKNDEVEDDNHSKDDFAAVIVKNLICYKMFPLGLLLLLFRKKQFILKKQIILDCPLSIKKIISNVVGCFSQEIVMFCKEKKGPCHIAF